VNTSSNGLYLLLHGVIHTSLCEVKLTTSHSLCQVKLTTRSGITTRSEVHADFTKCIEWPLSSVTVTSNMHITQLSRMVIAIVLDI
jgi:hypothetical protein